MPACDDPRPPALPLLIAGVLAVAVFAVTLGGTFVYDDVDLLLEDPRLLHPDRWTELFTTSYNRGEDNLYRPLVSLGYLVQHRLHGRLAWPYHLVNVLLHAAVSMAVATLAWRLTRRSHHPRAAWIAGVSGSAFASHPIHVEAVAGIVGRAELLATLATGLALSSLLRPLTLARAALAWAWFVVAMLSKEQGMLVPLLAVAMLACLARGQVAIPALEPRARERLKTLLAVMCLTLAAYVLVRQSFLKFDWDRSFLDWTIQPMIRAAGPDRWTLPLELVGRYVAAFVAPLHLSIDHGHAVITPRTNWASLHPWVGLATLLAWFVGIAVAWRRRAGVVAFLLVATAATVGVVLNLVTIIGTIFGERLMVLPSVFLAILLAIALARVPAASLRWAAVTLLVVAWSMLSIRYASRWSDRLAFYEQSLADNPRSLRLHVLAASEHQRLGNHPRAEAILHQAMALEPTYDELYLRAAHLAMDQQRFDEARRWLDRAMAISPRTRTSLWYGLVDQAEERARAGSATTKAMVEDATTRPAASGGGSGAGSGGATR
jgi:hypothetical protein